MSTITGVLSPIMALALCAFGVKSCMDSDWYQEEQRKQQAKYEAERQPRVIREVDGCKVYAFKSGEHWHYFTRCPNDQTSTDTARQVCQQHGKTRTCNTEYSTITTKESGQ